MKIESLPRVVAAVISIGMILSGIILGVWAFSRWDRVESSDDQPRSIAIDVSVDTPVTPLAASETPAQVVQDRSTPAPTATATPQTPLIVAVEESVPAEFRQILAQVVLSHTETISTETSAGPVSLRIDTNAEGGEIIYRSIFAVATRFDTINVDISAQAVHALWQGEPIPDRYAQIAVLSDTLPSLIALLGMPGATVYGYSDRDALSNAVWADQATLSILPFDLLIPELAVLRVDGQTPVENDNLFDQAAYAFTLPIYAHRQDRAAEADFVLTEIAKVGGSSNRRSEHLTVIAMTGVTAMVRLTAQQMDQYGPLWVAAQISDTLSAADLTIVSNEVPFVPGCTTNTAPDNLTFCSPPEYMVALEAIGVDLIGLTGNHQNDYGRDDALVSLQIYADAGLPIYGAGINKEEAFKPLYVEHNGNRLAFLGANSYGPPFAWATDTGPGSAEFDLNIMSATIRNIKERDLADVVLAELQYQESYDVVPLFDQRDNFRALSRTGADIVTGVQSHVPQAIEFQNGALILYGLGNLFFDQMQDTTREGMIVKHTIYQGRHISTQILTTLIYDYGQPHWTTPEQRTQLLNRVFGASYWERP